MTTTQTSTTKSTRKAVTTSSKKSSAKATTSKARAKTAGAKRGPRGFSVSSPAWIASVKSQAGIALKPANFPKLLATAIAYGVKTTSKKPETVVAAVARALH